ncbi:MAG: glycosyltransferase family 39 protein [Anaerolineaceae bacterium]|jgi:hypothetical protein|nr:glycosyltransferase family 39 protein [Anaerolineaceae bacterium]
MKTGAPSSFATALQRVTAARGAAEVVALLGGLVYLAQSVYYAHADMVSMDEGTYLTKGLLFATGVYRPFQDYGPWTNKMPLAFLVPGWAEAMFGPGLRTGRYLSVLLGVLLLLALWLAARRLAGRWPAAAVVWAMALNPGNVMLYSLAISQVQVACLLAWSLYLVLGDGRRLWQLVLGSLLAMATVLTRQNMAPAVALVLAYIWWQHGGRAFLWSTGAAAILFVLPHALYWPNILAIWAPWLPASLTPFLSAWRPVLNAASVSVQHFDWITRLYVFWEGMRWNFFALAGAVLTWILWPRRREWQSPVHFRAAVFLSVLLVTLTAMHLWAAIGQEYCVYCYTVYLPFFSLAGVLLVAVSFRSWVRRPGLLRQALAALAVLVLGVGIGFGAQQALDEPLLNLPIPRTRNLRILPGTNELWRSLSNKFGWSYEFQQQVLPTAAGLLFAVGLLALCLAYFLLRRKARLQWGAAVSALLAFFLLGSLLAPTPVFSGSSLPNDCGLDVIASHEAAGAHLAQLIPPGSRVYWQNDLSPAPLLYIPGAQIYPPQLNHWYSYLQGGDPDQLLKLGYWNEILAARWQQEADFLLVADQYVDSFYANQSLMGDFDELAPSPPVLPCESRSVIHIFRRVK